MDKRKFRHELKFYINGQSHAILTARLKHVLRRDENADENGEYHVRSLYFDDRDESSLRLKIEGLDDRDKVRIRVYNMSDEVIKLERKIKEGQYIAKQSCDITRQEFERLVYCDPTFLLKKKRDPAGYVYLAMRQRGLRPVKVVDYIREAYVFPVEEVRITFDKHLRMGADDFDIFNNRMLTVPMLEEGEMIMEVKFNAFLPEFIRDLLQDFPNERCAVSKYAICRKYEA